MADVLFRYMLAARAHDGAWHQRAFLADERLLAAGVERVIETAAIRVEVVSQHARVARASVVVPASKVHDVTFVEEVWPDEPEAGRFETRTERFPLAGTLKVEQCEPCRGAGIVNCGCQGTGQVTCARCNGTGRVFGETRCSGCHGDGHNRCERCRGRGFFKHLECDGEGKIASWDEEVRTYTVKRVRDALLPPEAPLRAMATAADEWLAKHGDVLPGISEDAFSAALGYFTPELGLMLAAARRVESTFQLKARTDPEPCLFSAVRLQCVPVSACLIRAERSGVVSRFWLVGRGEEAIEIRPRSRIDPWKSVGWPGLFAGGVAAFGLPTAGAAMLPLTAVAALGLGVAGVGLKRFLVGSGEPVRTVAVIPCSGQPTLYLTCLTTLGGYLNRLELRDRAFKTSIESMMGSPRPPHQSQTVVVKTDRDELVRLIEITQADRLSRPELARMMESVNGVLFLEDPEHSADALRKEMHIATAVRPPEVRLLVEADQSEADEHGLAPGGGVALEAARRAWTKEAPRQLDWPAVFERLWSPVTMVLSGLRVPVIRRRLASPLKLAVRRR